MDLTNTEIAFCARTDSDLKKGKLVFSTFGNEFLNSLGTSFTSFAFKIGLPIEPLVRPLAFALFCGGESIEGCQENIEKMGKYGVLTNLDYAIEGKQTDADFDKTKTEILRIIEYSQKQKFLKYTSVKPTGIVRTDLLAKDKAQRTKDEEAEWQRAITRLDDICQKVVEANISLLIDAEESWLQENVDELVFLMMKKYNLKKPYIYTTWQLYRHDHLKHLENSISLAKKEGFYLGAKLVRGAYLEKENKRAKELGYLSPIHKTKEGTDKDFDKAISLCIENSAGVSVCIATHNDQSVLHALKLLENADQKTKEMVFFAQLYGMGDHLSYNLAHAGFTICKYVPYGPVREVIPYLIRRAEENTAIKGQMGRELGLILKEIKRRGI